MHLTMTTRWVVVGLTVCCSGPEVSRAKPTNVDCVLTAWSSWSSCDLFSYKSHRTRSILVAPFGSGKACDALVESKLCEPVDCVVGAWSAFSSCDAEGFKSRTRSVTRAPQNGGTECPKLKDFVPCTDSTSPITCKPRDCVVSDWTPWTACDESHVTSRTRLVVIPPECGGASCPKLTDQKACSPPVDCQVSEWSAWSRCDKLGVRTRSRKLITSPQHGGAHCPALQETKKCLYKIPDSFPHDIADTIDPSLDPCDNFYQFSCGNWLESFVMPPGFYFYWFSSTPIEQFNHDILVDVLKSDKPMVTTYFRSCLYTSAINQAGIAPLQQALGQIDAASDLSDLMQVSGELSLEQFQFLTNSYAYANDKDAVHNVLKIEQSALTLDQSYYVDPKDFADIEQGFREYIAKILTLAKLVDEAQVDSSVNSIVLFEKQVASFMKSVDDMDDVMAMYNPMTLDEVSTKYPLSVGKVVHALLNKVGISTKLVVVTTPSYFDALEAFLSSPTLGVGSVKTWMKFQYVDKNRDQLSEDFLAASFAFYDKLLQGATDREDPNDICVNQVSALFPNLMGKYYAEKTFNAESEKAARNIADSIVQVMADRLHRETWLDDATRQAALAKIPKLEILIGHSDEVENLDGEPALSEATYFVNTQIIKRHARRTELEKLNKPVNRGEWYMTASEVNAYYDPSTNNIVLPAGILQPPLFNLSYLPAVNYGATGTTFGHELTHAFDPVGRLYDGDGNLSPWSTDSSDQQFMTKSKCVVDQYSSFSLPSCFNSSLILGNVDGSLTVGESIADLGGVSVTFEAFQKYMAKTQPKLSARMKKEMNQLFYISYAQSWCAVNSDEDAKWRLDNDYHAPVMYRVNGPILNDANFANLFQCPVGSKMNPKNKCSVW